jgi:hypothetical protein
VRGPERVKVEDVLDADKKKAIAAHIERLWRERTPMRDVLDGTPMQRVLYVDVLAAFPELGVFGREEVTPIHNQVMKKLRKEFPDEPW